MNEFLKECVLDPKDLPKLLIKNARQTTHKISNYLIEKFKMVYPEYTKDIKPDALLPNYYKLSYYVKKF